MKRNGAEGFSAKPPVSHAANEEFTGTVKSQDRLEKPRSGWDPFEVWRTRVKASASATSEQERDPLR